MILPKCTRLADDESSHREYYHLWQRPIARGVAAAYYVKYENRHAGEFPWGLDVQQYVINLLTHIIPEDTNFFVLQELAGPLAMHLFEVIAGKVPLCRQMLRTLLLSSDKDVRLWAIQHSAIKSS